MTQLKSEECYEIYHPIERVGIYVPGGKASYPSTVLMTATLAQVAGVKSILPSSHLNRTVKVLAVCFITGVNHVYQVGGAQSIAALTYGTDAIKKVDKIVGPGNQFVAYAKSMSSGR